MKPTGLTGDPLLRTERKELQLWCSSSPKSAGTVQGTSQDPKEDSIMCSELWTSLKFLYFTIYIFIRVHILLNKSSNKTLKKKTIQFMSWEFHFISLKKQNKTKKPGVHSPKLKMFFHSRSKIRYMNVEDLIFTTQNHPISILKCLTTEGSSSQ